MKLTIFRAGMPTSSIKTVTKENYFEKMKAIFEKDHDSSVFIETLTLSNYTLFVDEDGNNKCLPYNQGASRYATSISKKPPYAIMLVGTVIFIESKELKDL